MRFNLLNVKPKEPTLLLCKTPEFITTLSDATILELSLRELGMRCGFASRHYIFALTFELPGDDKVANVNDARSITVVTNGLNAQVDVGRFKRIVSFLQSDVRALDSLLG